MYLHSLRLKNFKGFRGESDEICFHGPNGKPGSGLNILVGENNAGKSTILQAISFLREYSSQKKDPTSIAPNAASNETISDTITLRQLRMDAQSSVNLQKIRRQTCWLP